MLKVECMSPFSVGLLSRSFSSAITLCNRLGWDRSYQDWVQQSDISERHRSKPPLQTTISRVCSSMVHV